jgi:hypothetical protein
MHEGILVVTSECSCDDVTIMGSKWTSYLRIHVTVLVFVGAAFVCIGFSAWGDEQGWLVTPEEAAMQLKDGEFIEPMAAKKGPGPLIVVKSPKILKQLRSPVDIHVVFEPGASGRPAAMKTLRVLLVGFIPINITDRLRKYIDGHSLNLEQAELPTGKHRMRMRIKDVDGNANERDVVIKVLKK